MAILATAVERLDSRPQVCRLTLLVWAPRLQLLQLMCRSEVRVILRVDDTAGCQTGCTAGWTTGCIM